MGKKTRKKKKKKKKSCAVSSDRLLIKKGNEPIPNIDNVHAGNRHVNHLTAPARKSSGLKFAHIHTCKQPV